MDTGRVAVEPTVWPPVLGRESPALANLLVNQGELTRPAVSATWLDLAARGFMSIEEVSPRSYVCRLRRTPDQGELNDYEQQVYDAVARECVDRVAPVDMLTRELRRQPQSWMHRFWRGVAEEGARLDLVTWSGRWRWVNPWTVGAVVALLVASVLVLLVEAGLVDGGLVAAIYVGVLVIAGAVVDPNVVRMRVTDDGRDAAARWRGVRRQLEQDEVFEHLPPSAVAIWRRYLAYGAALGVAHEAATAMPMGDDPGRRAWSAASGRWRRIRISYPRGFPPAWGRNPRRVVLTTLLFGAAALALLAVLARPGEPYPNPPFSSGAATAIGDAEPVLWVVGVLVLAWCAVAFACALADLGAPEVRTGTVVRVRARRGPLLWPQVRLPARWFVAMDAGASDHVRAVRVRPELVDAFIEGERVDVEMTRRLGYVRSVRPAPVVAPGP